MRNKRFLIALAGAIVFGLIATLSILRYVSTAQAYTNSLGSVVVAKFPIQLGAKINADQLALVQMPNGSAPDGAFNSIEKVVGRVAITNINVREPLTSYKLAIEGAAGGLSAVIPEGYRAMTVKVDDVVGISGFVMPGSFVDVVAVITPDDQATNNPVSKIVLQNIKVLANGQNIDQPKDGRETTNVKAVTLQVTPDQAERLALATNEGKLQLVMRNFGDQDPSETPGANKRTLLSGEAYSYTPPTPRSETPRPVAPAPMASSPRIIYEPAPQMREPRRIPVPVAPVAAAPPVVRRPSVEMIEGTKKSSIEFP